jgi:SNF2 family DNA or RNA helicase
MKRAFIPILRDGSILRINQNPSVAKIPSQYKYNRFLSSLVPEIAIRETNELEFRLVLSVNSGEWYVDHSDIEQDFDCIICDGKLRQVDTQLLIESIRELKILCEIHKNSLNIAGMIHVISNSKTKINLESFESALFKLNCEIPFQQMPRSFIGVPYPHQETGIQWMWDKVSKGLGFVLGDEMGLGKTFQTIATFCRFKELGNTSPCIVICPSSLQRNWVQEFQQFAPSLRVCVHRGPQRTGLASRLSAYDVIVMSYGVLVSPLDRKLLNEIEWGIIALDEAQAIKNPNAQRTLAAKSLKSQGRIAITGTPLENSIQDMWSIFDFCMPGLLGLLDQFNEIFSNDIHGAKRIEVLTSPLLLRRMIQLVKDDLPDILTYEHIVEMSEFEQDAYAQFSTNYQDKGLLAQLQYERQFCCWPKLVLPHIVDNPTTKLHRLFDILDSLSGGTDKVVIFTSFTQVLDKLRNEIAMRYYGETMDNILFIDGRNSTEAIDIIREFENQSGFAVICLNPKAAGVGLNITAANHVIHYNPEWNPAITSQATARVFRIGQEKNVIVHWLYYENTIEERMIDILDRKSELFAVAVKGNTGKDILGISIDEIVSEV